ncbi:MAG TPA: DUF433 domain-containing protein [Desulfobacterales bacterium]|nr:MAG: hypothetical protein DRI57_09635 [Deltaproteobacteria bacterium]HHC25686.1 DUF433 domain-containing protein [Desulfobacterales bacterium]
MNISEHIDINPEVMLGKPVIMGTRIPVELILRKLGEGIAEHDLLDAYPKLTREDILAAMTYAAETIACEELIIPAPYQHQNQKRYAENAISC